MVKSNLNINVNIYRFLFSIFNWKGVHLVHLHTASIIVCTIWVTWTDVLLCGTYFFTCLFSPPFALKSQSNVTSQDQWHFTFSLDNLNEWICSWVSLRRLNIILWINHMPGLTLRRNKHVQGSTTKIRPQGNLFYQPDIRLNNTPKIQKNVEYYDSGRFGGALRLACAFGHKLALIRPWLIRSIY